jgi:hypothetical protein
MGFVPIPAQPLTTDNWLSAFDLFSKNSDLVMHHVHFDSGNIEGLNFITGMATKYNLKTLIVIDPLSDDRTKIDPGLLALGKDFADQKVRDSYTNLAVKVATEYSPEFLSLGSEINTYLANNPSDATAFISLIEETNVQIKQAAPGITTTLSLQYEELAGKTGKAEWEIAKQLNGTVDAIAFTTYPSAFFNSPEEIPSDYYSQIKDNITAPLIIAESGWPSAGSHGSATKQKAFVEKLSQVSDDLKVKAWIWWFPHDWDGAGYAEVFKTMGLRKANGTPKSAWDSWVAIYRAN